MGLIDLVVADSVPNIIIKNKKTGEKVVFVAVHNEGEAVALGPIDGRNDKLWLQRCWLISKKELVNNYELVI